MIRYLAVFLVAALPVAAQDNSSGAAANAQNQNLNSSGSIAYAGNTYLTPGVTSSSTDNRTRIETNPGLAGIGVVPGYVCSHAAGLTGSVVGTGLGVTGSYTDKECNVRAEAAALQAVAGNAVAMFHLAANDPEICATLRATGQISADSDCTAKERKQRANAKPVAASSRSTAYAQAVCERKNGKLRYSVDAHFVDQASAKANCRARLQ